MIEDSDDPNINKITDDELLTFLLTLYYDYIQILAPSYEFEVKQHNYITNLTKEQIKLLEWYTFTGDAVMNSYLRNKLDIKAAFLNIINIAFKIDYKIIKDMTNDEYDNLVSGTDEKRTKIFVYEFIGYAISIINEVIINAPKNDKPFIVFQYADKLNSIRNDNYWENLGFYSTTLINDSAFDVGKTTKYKSYIIVPENTPCLFIYNVSRFPSELEILFSYNNCFKVLKHFNENDTLYKSYPDALISRIIKFQHIGQC